MLIILGGKDMAIGQVVREKELIAIIRERSVDKGFKTDFFYFDGETIQGVNKVLGEMVENFNRSQERLEQETGNYHTKIPFTSNGHQPIKYSFGCGNTHYLQRSLFEDISKVSSGYLKEFPLNKIQYEIVVYAPDEVEWAQKKYDYQF